MTRTNITAQALRDKNWEPAIDRNNQPFDMDAIVNLIKSGARVDIKTSCLLKRKLGYIDGQLMLIAPASELEMARQRKIDDDDNYWRGVKAALSREAMARMRRERNRCHH